MSGENRLIVRCDVAGLARPPAIGTHVSSPFTPAKGRVVDVIGDGPQALVVIDFTEGDPLAIVLLTLLESLTEHGPDRQRMRLGDSWETFLAPAGTLPPGAGWVAVGTTDPPTIDPDSKGSQ